MIRRFTGIALALFVGISFLVLPQDAASALVLRGRVVDGTGAGAIEQGAVVISEDRIVDVGDQTDIDIPEEADVIDVGDATILPGFINTHVHFSEAAGIRRLWLRGGVTTIRDVGARYAPGWTDVLYVDESDPTEPRVLAAGPLVTVVGGYPNCTNFDALSVTSPSDAERQINELIDFGADVIKITVTTHRCECLSLELIRAITDAAHRRGVLVTAHVDTAEDAQLALDGGVDELAHTPATLMSDNLIRDLVKQGVAMVSTLAILREPPAAMSNARRFHLAGGTLVLGNDAGYLSGVRIGMPMNEVRALARVGLTPMEILLISTANAAEACQLSDVVGTLEAGKLADILVVEGNPLEELEVLDDTLLVLRNGTMVVDNRPED